MLDESLPKCSTCQLQAEHESKEDCIKDLQRQLEVEREAAEKAFEFIKHRDEELEKLRGESEKYQLLRKAVGRVLEELDKHPSIEMPLCIGFSLGEVKYVFDNGKASLIVGKVLEAASLASPKEVINGVGKRSEPEKNYGN